MSILWGCLFFQPKLFSASYSFSSFYTKINTVNETVLLPSVFLRLQIILSATFALHRGYFAEKI